MDLFKDIKSTVTARIAAEQYGLSVDKNAMAICPFHEDHNPSLKVSCGFHCFSCGAQGDVITFIAMLFGISAGAAARKLAVDFGIESKGTGRGPPKEPTWQDQAKATLHEYYDHLLAWKQVFQPQEPSDPFHPCFVEALQRQADIREWLRILEFGTEIEKEEFKTGFTEEVKQIAERMHDTGGDLRSAPEK